jgi:hypothetical protein
MCLKLWSKIEVSFVFIMNFHAINLIITTSAVAHSRAPLDLPSSHPLIPPPHFILVWDQIINKISQITPPQTCKSWLKWKKHYLAFQWIRTAVFTRYDSVRTHYDDYVLLHTQVQPDRACEFAWGGGRVHQGQINRMHVQLTNTSQITPPEIPNKSWLKWKILSRVWSRFNDLAFQWIRTAVFTRHDSVRTHYDDCVPLHTQVQSNGACEFARGGGRFHQSNCCGQERVAAKRQLTKLLKLL